MIAGRLRDARKAKGMTQADLADSLGVSRHVVSRIECGAAPKIALLLPMAKALNTTADYLLGGPDPTLVMNALRSANATITELQRLYAAQSLDASRFRAIHRHFPQLIDMLLNVDDEK